MRSPCIQEPLICAPLSPDNDIFPREKSKKGNMCHLWVLFLMKNRQPAFVLFSVKKILRQWSKSCKLHSLVLEKLLESHNGCSGRLTVSPCFLPVSRLPYIPKKKPFKIFPFPSDLFLPLVAATPTLTQLRGDIPGKEETWQGIRIKIIDRKWRPSWGETET